MSISHYCWKTVVVSFLGGQMSEKIHEKMSASHNRCSELLEAQKKNFIMLSEIAQNLNYRMCHDAQLCRLNTQHTYCTPVYLSSK